MNITAFSVCCLISVCVILPAVSSATTDCCLFLSATRLRPNKVKSYHIQTAGGICPINVVVIRTIENMRICADPDLEWVKKAMKRVDEAKSGAKTESSNTQLPGGNGPRRRRKGNRKRPGKGKRNGGRRGQKTQAR